MSIRYSDTTKCFYPEEIEYPSLPSDLVSVSMQQWLDVISARALQKEVAFINGVFTIGDVPADVTRSKAISEIKAQASEEINALLPQQKQLNSLARSVELILKKIEGSISTLEEGELSNIRALWSQIKAIRDASNQAEEELNG